jgi:hypothetical protein
MNELKNEFVTTQGSGFSFSEAGTIETWKAFHTVREGERGRALLGSRDDRDVEAMAYMSIA